MSRKVISKMNSTFILLFLGFIVGSDCLLGECVFPRTGFFYNYVNDWKCKLSYNRRPDFTQDSIVDSYFNKSGDYCQINCRVRKGNNFTRFEYFSLKAPDLTCCGSIVSFKICLGGECVPSSKIIANIFKKNTIYSPKDSPNTGQNKTVPVTKSDLNVVSTARSVATSSEDFKSSTIPSVTTKLSQTTVAPQTSANPSTNSTA